MTGFGNQTYRYFHLAATGRNRVLGAEDLRLLPAALRCKERANHRASGRGQGFCTRLQQRSLAGAFLLALLSHS